MRELAERVERMGTEAAFRVFARAKALERAGHDVVHLEMGEPDAPTPQRIVAAAERALRAGHTGYAPAAGLPELRAAIARHTGERRGLAYAPEQVVVTPGGKAVIFFAYMALVEPGDEVVYPDPGFPIFESLVHALGAVARPYHPGSGSSLRPDLARLEQVVGPRTKLIVLNSPGNPTGVVFRRDELERVAALARRHDVWVLSDEIYSRILYGSEHVSIAALPGMAERTIVLDGFSKTWAMTGWRLGWAAAPVHIAQAFERLMTNSASCCVHFAQRAALAAFEGGDDELASMVASLHERRDVLVDGLAALPGVRCDRPEGSFFVFADVRGTGRPARELADRLLEDAHVALVEGTAFGAAGEGHLRFSYASPRPRIEEALRRLARAL
jgi:aspartate/methionine/tyrosine aminotransferase